MNTDTTGSLYLPPTGSTIASEVDSLFNFVLYASIVFFLLVVTLSLYFAFRYRKRGKERLDSAPSHNIFLEILWTAIPVILVFTVFFWGFKVYLKMNVVPKDAMEIKVTAQKWFWSFNYVKDGVNSLNELVVPVGKPVKLTMSSQDVIHSFYVPGFRIKMDILPNRYTITWFEATNIGAYDLFCAEYCGTGHSEMIGKVKAVSLEDYKIWLDEAGLGSEDMPLGELGAKAFKSKACQTCHNVDGTAAIGPALNGIFGKQERMADGQMITVDENYLRESMLNPAAKVVNGYQAIMPSYQGLLKDREIDALIEYIKSLNEE
jgi:cytochrome c oxidase subunit II